MTSMNAEDLWLECGPHARAGFPMPEGQLPVLLARSNSISLVTPQEWQRYQDLIQHLSHAP